MDDLIEYLLQFGDLDKQQIELISARAKPSTLRKGDYFSEPGKVPRQVGFMTRGIIRVFYQNNEGDEITRYFVAEKNFVVDGKNFEANTMATECMQAVTDCKMLVFSKKNLEYLSNTVVVWDSIVNKIIRKALTEKLERRSPMVEQDAKTRYLTFLEKYPALANQIPLSYVASYLGITQSSLSRIRKNIR